MIGISAARGAETVLKSRTGYFSQTANDVVGLNSPSGKSGWGALSWALYQTANAKKAEDHGLIRWSTVFNDSNTFKTAIYGNTAEQLAGSALGTSAIRGALYIGSDQGPQYDVVIKPYERPDRHQQHHRDPHNPAPAHRGLCPPHRFGDPPAAGPGDRQDDDARRRDQLRFGPAAGRRF